MASRCVSLICLTMAVGWHDGVCCSSLLADEVEFFERKIRPALIEHCYSCHSDQASKVKGGLRLDLKSGWQQGGESGQAVIVPGKPEQSLLIQAVRHEGNVSPMPPDQSQLPDAIIADLTTWIQQGAHDPRHGEITDQGRLATWEDVFRQRVQWWSLQPLVSTQVPKVTDTSDTERHANTLNWPRTPVDSFILDKLREQSLQPVGEADRYALVRRLSFALTGLPPDAALVQQFFSDDSPQAYQRLVDRLLDSPHFGERWARHWMDVVHYADTHGYEWDVPAKNAWRFRDYLIRAFNDDLPYRDLVIEQIAGDLIAPRVDTLSGVNQALIGPMMLRLGERRHGDNAAAEGVTQEAVANMIDTLGKAFLGTTLACAQCHDHKLDAVEQRDYYSLAGMLMSTRYSARPINTSDDNLATIEQLRDIKEQLRAELAGRWLEATAPEQLEAFRGQLQAAKCSSTSETLPASIAEFWQRSTASAITIEQFFQERQRRIVANQGRLKLVADFSRAGDVAGWRWEGWGMRHGLVADGELVVADQGDQALLHVLPAGRFSHVWSQRLAGSLQSPQLDTTKPFTLSLEMIAGKFSSLSFIIDRALNSERLQFPQLPIAQWKTLTAGNFDTLEGSIDNVPRRVYLELATKSLNNYFPPRVGYGGLIEEEIHDERSWFGVSRVYEHPAGHPPEDELARFVPLFQEFSQEADWSVRLASLLRAAIERWQQRQCSSADVELLNDALHSKLLPNDIPSGSEVERLVNAYRTIERRIEPDKTVGSAADWPEGSDDRLAVRGDYTALSDVVPRGRLRFLPEPQSPDSSASGRLAWAELITDDANPLLARVYVNRVWHYLFGTGLVRTPDDFGHLGELPSHPELLDYLAQEFIANGWSTKRLIRLLVTSAVWRQSSVPVSRSLVVDPENRWWHHYPMRRLEAEAIRDSLLAVSGRLDPMQYGAPVHPFRTAEDKMKRLFQGPVDGLGRRSIYLEMTLMEPPRFLALFNQPIPKFTVGRRDVSNVPDQALALLNDPFVLEMARCWSQHLMNDKATSAVQRAANMLQTALWRSVSPDEVGAVVQLVRRSADLRATSSDILLQSDAWQDAAHAIFNLKEFVYLR
ncbi:MAG: PSD1 domain-containing protein [Pirellulaceae bacterium]|nr:PSD1 domain-containing protein [Pirellulaceae bacterium]